MNYKLLDQLMEVRGKKQKDLAEFIGITPYGLSLSIKKKTMTVNSLEKAALFYDVPVTIFFDGSTIKDLKKIDRRKDEYYMKFEQQVKKNEEMLKEMLNMCQELNSSKDKEIKELKNRIKELEK